MDESTNVLAWPTCPGYMTVKPLSTKSPCKVWLIRRESDQQYMVLKLSLTMENVASQRLHNVNAARKYVVDSYGMLSTQLGDGLLMEYCPGGSLAALMARRSNFTLAECVTALAPIAQAIAGLHAAGMRHGDISPSNIMLTAQGMPKIIDFQEASLSQDAAEVAGTPGFIAPETFTGAGEEELGARDVFALGRAASGTFWTANHRTSRITARRSGSSFPAFPRSSRSSWPTRWTKIHCSAPPRTNSPGRCSPAFRPRRSTGKGSSTLTATS